MTFLLTISIFFLVTVHPTTITIPAWHKHNQNLNTLQFEDPIFKALSLYLHKQSACYSPPSLENGLDALPELYTCQISH